MPIVFDKISKSMTTEEYKQLWKRALHLCEIEPDKGEATSFVYRFYDKNPYGSMSERELLLTFVRLVVYEKKFQLQFGSTTPASFCYRELLRRADYGSIDKDFIYDLGDWAAVYADNPYVPMGTYRGYGPRQFYLFWSDYEKRLASEQQAKLERLERKRAEGEAKVQVAKQAKLDRLAAIQELRDNTVDESIQMIAQSGKSVFYYIDLIEEWFSNDILTDSQKAQILSLFPSKSTKHNNRKRKLLEDL